MVAKSLFIYFQLSIRSAGLNLFDLRNEICHVLITSKELEELLINFC